MWWDGACSTFRSVKEHDSQALRRRQVLDSQNLKCEKNQIHERIAVVRMEGGQEPPCKKDKVLRREIFHSTFLVKWNRFQGFWTRARKHRNVNSKKRETAVTLKFRVKLNLRNYRSKLYKLIFKKCFFTKWQRTKFGELTPIDGGAVGVAEKLKHFRNLKKIIDTKSENEFLSLLTLSFKKVLYAFWVIKDQRYVAVCFHQNPVTEETESRICCKVQKDNGLRNRSKKEPPDRVCSCSYKFYNDSVVWKVREDIGGILKRNNPVTDSVASKWLQSATPNCF